MIVRKATIEDVGSIVDFQLLMATETEEILLDKRIVNEGVLAVLKDNSKGIYYVAEINEKVVSSLLTTFEWSDWRNGTILWIQSVYVLQEFRRKGIYRSMYSFIKEEVLNNTNLKGIRLYADKSNYPAQKTYKTLGMSPDHYVTFEWLK
jgi:ribosomal protein S18 acetylase RimI-like enzyme